MPPIILGKQAIVCVCFCVTDTHEFSQMSLEKRHILHRLGVEFLYSEQKCRICGIKVAKVKSSLKLGPLQGGQMVYFQTENPYLDIFGGP
jgi:hypothetical protein